MSKTKISLFSSDSANNTDIDGINLAEGMAPGLVNNAIRELMAQLKDFQVGSAGDPLTVGGNLAVTGTSSFTGNATFVGNVTIGGRIADSLPSGTKMLFQQTAAPLGWVKDTTNDNKALRVVSGTAGTGGSIAFTTAFGSQNVSDTALSIAQIPSHNHTFNVNSGTQSANHVHTGNTDVAGLSGSFAVGGPNESADGVFSKAGDTGRRPGLDFNSGSQHRINFNASHAHSFTTSGNNVSHFHNVNGTTVATGSGASHNHSLNLAVQYVDVIVATKS